MSTQVSALYESARKKYHLVLHGGQAGLTNSAYWVYLAEDFQNMSFLKGGEMVITTGLFTQSGITLNEFIYALVMRNCSGILINTGKYLQISDITPELVEFCNSHSFPVFTMPWEVHLVDIMQDYCILLMRSNQTEEQLNATLQSALYQNPVQENVLRTLNHFGLATAAEYRMIAIQNLNNANKVTSKLHARQLKYYLFEHENLWLLLYDCAQNKPSLSEIIDTICFDGSIKVGVSDTIHSLAEMSPCYKRARFSLAAADFWERRVVNFDDLGLFQVLFCTSDIEMLHKMVNQRLGPLKQYDENHGSDYMNTLRTFLLSDCNILETADRMHTHRNTIVYRIRKIKEILNTELNHSSVKFDLLMAFTIREFFEIAASNVG